MQKSFHMAFTALQRDVHQHMHVDGNALENMTADELAQSMVLVMDAAEAKGADVARAVLNKLALTKRAAKTKRGHNARQRLQSGAH